MLKKRIIGVVLIKSGLVVQSIGFNKYLPIGKPEIAISYLNRWGIDEIVALHIDANSVNHFLSIPQVMLYAKHCQVPLTVGGGIDQLEMISNIIRAGADKVVLNTSLIENPHLITQGGKMFGQQSIVVSIDVRRQPNGVFQCYTHGGKKPVAIDIMTLVRQAEKLGAGEILLTSIDNDGKKQGFDLELLQTVVNAVNIPVIICGGAGHPDHLKSAISCGASAVAVGNLFHFTEHSVTVTKRYLTANAQPVRLDTYVNYESLFVNEIGRVAKQTDEKLDQLRFQAICEESI